MDALLIILFLALVGGIYVAIGRSVVPRPLRRPLSQDLLPAFRRGVVTMYRASATYPGDSRAGAGDHAAERPRETARR
jgi:hypothetical protein